MVVYYRVVGGNGEKRVLFAGIEELPAGDAETITATLLGRIARDGIPFEKLMCFGSDGNGDDRVQRRSFCTTAATESLHVGHPLYIAPGGPCREGSLE